MQSESTWQRPRSVPERFGPRQRNCGTAAPRAGPERNSRRISASASFPWPRRIAARPACSAGAGIPAVRRALDRVGRVTPQSRLDLAKQPRATECGAGHHDAVDSVAAKDLHHALGRSQVSVTDERYRAQESLDFRDPFPIGLAFEIRIRRASVNGQRRRARFLDDLGHFSGVDLLARAPQANLGGNRHRLTRLHNPPDDFPTRSGSRSR